MSVRIMYKSYSLVAIILKLGYLFSISQSSEQAPFTSEIVGSILATDSREKSQSTLFRKSWVLSGRSGFLRQGKLVGWVRIKDMNTVMKVISQLLKRYYNILRYNYSFVSYILDKRDLYLYWRTKIVSCLGGGGTGD
jgi:hypothetical protein